MALGRLAVAAATFLACFSAGESAIAVGRVLVPAGGERSVREVRLAVALAPRQTTVWWSIDLPGPKRRMAVVVPAAPAAAVDPASSAWFDALERATAPRVVLSAGRALCGGAEGSPVHDTSEASGAAAIGVSEFAALSSLDQVAGFALARGLAYAPEDRAALLPYGATHRFVALSFDVPENGGWTETVRMTSRRPEPALMFELLGNGAKLPVRLWTIAGARARLPPAREYEPEELAVVWNLAKGKSDYPERRDAWFESRRETSWLLESAGEEVLYDWRLLPRDSGAIQPVTASYFAEDAAGICAARVLEAKGDGRRVGAACAPGKLGSVEATATQPACVESPLATEIDPETLRCGTLDDLALALADQAPDHTWITRHRGVVLANLAQKVEFDGAAPESASPIVFASAVDATGCGSTGGSFGAGGASGASGTSSGSGGWGGMGGVSTPPDRGGSGNNYPDYPEEPRPHVHEGSSVEVGCTSSGGDADCGGDTSSGGGSDSCSGDSGSDAEDTDSEGCGCDSADDEGAGDDGGDDCGGDSSSEGGDDCGGDSSGESGDDCGGDSSGEGGDDCSGDSSGGDDCSGESGGGDCGGGETAALSASIGVGSVRQITAAVCSLPRPRRFRPRVSAVTLVLCAVALCLRRAKRGTADLERGRW